jgi:hypothetical protein
MVREETTMMSQNQSTIEIIDNKGNLRRLVDQLKTPLGVIPFVGAGLCIPFGFPSWTDFLLTQGRSAGIEEKIKEHLEKGEYEEAAEDLLNALSDRAFQDKIEDVFGDHHLEGKELKGAVSLLPQLASGPVITTNLDRVLEKVFNFEHVVWGSKVDMIPKALQRNKRFLLKVHGDLEDRTDRVLTLTEYQKHYGNIDFSKIDPKRSLPLSLELMFTSRTLLFVGCSLDKDRTLGILKQVAKKQKGIAHYAIIEKPDNDGEYHQKVRHLSEHNIRPIWYPAGKHDLIEQILADLIKEYRTIDYKKFERQLPGLHFFTKDNIEEANYSFSSFHFNQETYGTFNTPYSVINNSLIRDIKTKIKNESFFLIHGNSGRGKTFFIFNFIQKVIDIFDVIIYYSPQFRSGKTLDLELLFKPLEEVLFSVKRLLFIIDDFHLINNKLKSDILDELIKHDKVSIIVVSRSKEEDSVPPKYQQNKYFKNFNGVAEKVFEQILQKFKQKHDLVSTQQIEEDLRRETDGANLVFLTLLLNSWDKLLSEKKEVSFEEVRIHAYTRFCNSYEKNHSIDWKNINHFVSALFQYEIKIDPNYLTTKYNKYLSQQGLNEYLHGRLIHDKMVSEENQRFFYVFMDFAFGEEKDMMKHASEFRFYLEAYGKNLIFGEVKNLDRIEFTKLVLEHYILFEPSNLGEVFNRIRSNAGRKEKKIIMDYLNNNKKIKSVNRQFKTGILKLFKKNNGEI